MKNIIGAVVGGILMFICQFLSWGLLDLHRPSQEYTEHQDEILAFLGTKFQEDGAYFLPNIPKGSSQEEMEKYQKESQGKPWAQIYYHKGMDMNMGMNMGRGLAVDIIMIFLVVWLFGKMANPDFMSVLLSSLAIGMVIFFFSPYTSHIWYKTFDLNAHLIDAIASWGIVGAWLGFWLNRK